MLGAEFESHELETDLGQCRIRTASQDDVDGLYDLDTATLTAGDGMVMSPADQSDRADYSKRVRSMLENRQNNAILVTELVSASGNQIIGEAKARRFPLSRLNHVAILDIQIHPLFQSMGFGRKLFESLLVIVDSAKPPIYRAELNVRADNQRAQSLYESLGFEREGIRRSFLRTADSEFVDDWLMARLTF